MNDKIDDILKNKNIDELSNELVQSLQLVKDDYTKCKKELNYSIRKDIIITSLRDVIYNNKDYNSLKDGIINIINALK